jgi:hypothetical protein
MQARKLSFQEAWDSSTIFFVDEALENEIDARVSSTAWRKSFLH